ncbi:MAG: 50S ribosomal protein L15 [Rhodobacteraceae bacterium]|nr:50S ribosomal protein L15 [Paracoccaceae bacterium]
MKLNEIADVPGARKRRKRVGRGPGSGYGKTCGRGMNGQKARSGTAMGAFEGGQMPLYQRLPKRGFKNRGRRRINTISLSSLQRAIDSGKLDASRTIDCGALVRAGLVRRELDGVKALAGGELQAAVTLELQSVSAAARAAVEAAGGKVILVSK